MFIKFTNKNKNKDQSIKIKNINKCLMQYQKNLKQH